MRRRDGVRNRTYVRVYTKNVSRIKLRQIFVVTKCSFVAVSSVILDRMPPFGFLTNHGLAMLCIAHDPGIRMRDVAGQLEITERAAQRIVADLIDAGYLERERIGRRNRYTIRTGLQISLPNSRDVDVNALLNVLLPTDSSAERKGAMPSVEAA